MKSLLFLLLLADGKAPSITLVADEPVRMQGVQFRKAVPGEAARVEFVSAEGKLRRTVPVNGVDEVRRVVRMHEEGRETFRVGCIRCHGEDGNLDTYFGIRKLGGIGSRLTLDEIRARMHPLPMGSSGVTVRGHLVSRERLDSLIAYVAAL